MLSGALAGIVITMLSFWLTGVSDYTTRQEVIELIEEKNKTLAEAVKNVGEDIVEIKNTSKETHDMIMDVRLDVAINKEAAKNQSERLDRIVEYFTNEKNKQDK